jgi:phosphohistidine swiveling domain-containing protein
MIRDFKDLKSDETFVGGKAYVLAMMAQAGLPVPAGLILTELPRIEEEWLKVMSWWKQIGSLPLAVRSSAFGEDSKEMSFAGQNKTFLSVNNPETLRKAIAECFLSVDREASQAYRQFSLGQQQSVPMNVVLQVMVEAQYSGVFFSVHPTDASKGSMLEYVEGFGESLVSGHIDPFRVLKSDLEKNSPFSETEIGFGPLSKEILKRVIDLGENAETKLNEKVDMEWAVDRDQQITFLQARPITATHSKEKFKQIIELELKNINQKFPQETWWDGQTFAEWTTQPTPLTFDVWRKAFAPHGAFDQALKSLGYLGFQTQEFSPHHSILQPLFGRAYVNMNEMVPLYFGPIPYEINPHPKPHLKFNWKKINPEGILRTPQSLWRMITVGWAMSTQRRYWIDLSRKELTDFKHKMQRPLDQTFYEKWSEVELHDLWAKEIYHFSTLSLKWPLILVVLIEATHQSLKTILKSLVPEKTAEDLIQRWMGEGITSASFEMNRYFARAQEEPLKREFFFSRYGHRGPGELELSNPRWIELGDSAFEVGLKERIKNHSSSGESQKKSKNFPSHVQVQIEAEIRHLKTFKEPVLLEEWKLLKELLELREFWKMEILKPYAHIRYLTLHLGRKKGLYKDIFFLKQEEITQFCKNVSSIDQTDLAQLHAVIKLRKSQQNAFRQLHLPDVLKKSEIPSALKPLDTKKDFYRGLSLSSGVVKGTVRVIHELQDVHFQAWPESVILVTEATDPGWTALFMRVKGIIVERGGVLSHCAILAREMGIPSLNVSRATTLLKDGDEIWLDAHQGGFKHVSRS